MTATRGGHTLNDIKGKIAVVTGGGTGMGRELALALTKAGAHVAICDISEENMAQTQALCLAAAPADTRVTTYQCDVSIESQMDAFRDAVIQDQATHQIHMLFNNAGIGGGGSFLEGERDQWEKTFAVCWYGVYYGARAFLPLLVAGSGGHIVNTSSVNGFWASLGPGIPHTAYSAAKFAVKGFTEALITDLRINAPHVQAHVVMPGHIGTSIAINSGKVLGTAPEDLGAAEIALAREQMVAAGLPVGNESDEHIRDIIRSRGEAFRDNAPMTAATAAEIILREMQAGNWRILVGDDAQVLDHTIRADPMIAYDDDFIDRLQSKGIFKELRSSVTGEMP